MTESQMCRICTHSIYEYSSMFVCWMWICLCALCVCSHLRIKFFRVSIIASCDLYEPWQRESVSEWVSKWGSEEERERASKLHRDSIDCHGHSSQHVSTLLSALFLSLLPLSLGQGSTVPGLTLLWEGGRGYGSRAVSLPIHSGLMAN